MVSTSGPSPEKRLRDAFHRRDAGEVRRLLQRHPELRERLDAPVFPFDAPSVVAFAGDAQMLEVLLDSGADPNARSQWWAGGFHALHCASVASAELLLGAGAVPDACAAAHLDRPDLLAPMLAADPARVHERGGDGQTPLHFARSREVVDLLLGAGADADARDVDHRASAAEWMLDRARGAGRYELARYLVERGASADIFLATALGLSDRSRAMVDADPALLDLRTGHGTYAEQPPSSHHIYLWTIGEGRSPLDTAAQFEQSGTVEQLLEVATPLQRLHFACRRGDDAAARAVLREHPGIVAAMTPRDHRSVTDAAWNGDARSVALMLDLGFDPRTPGRDSGTALHCAAWAGSSPSVAALLRHPAGRALIALPDPRHGATPLGWCCHGSRFGNGSHDHAGVATLLLEAGAQPGGDTTEASPPVEAVLGTRPRPGPATPAAATAPGDTP